jgi:hypothetical protein
MDNFILFVLGLTVTLISAFGVIVYAMTPPSYEKPSKEPEPDIDMGAFGTKVEFEIEAAPAVPIPAGSKAV